MYTISYQLKMELDEMNINEMYCFSWWLNDTVEYTV